MSENYSVALFYPDFMQATLKDLAKRLGLAPSTISRALKGHPDISKETQLKVRKLAEEMNYSPNTIAASLRCRKSNFIAVIVPEIDCDFYAAFVDGVENILYNNDYYTILFQSRDDCMQEAEICRKVVAGRMKGVLISMAKTTRSIAPFLQMKEEGVAILFFDRIAGGMDTDRVVSDDFGGAYKAVSHLISEGCRKIVHYAGEQYIQVFQKRRAGYIKALQDAGIPADERLIVPCEEEATARRITSQVIEAYRPDGIFAVNDRTAAETLSVLKGMGYRVPEDIAVCGFSDDRIAEVTDPSLTSVNRSAKEMGKIAAELLLKRMRSVEDEPTVTKILETRLKIRKSTKKQKAGRRDF